MRLLLSQSIWIGVSCLLLASLCHSQVNRCFPNEVFQKLDSRNFSRGVEGFGLNMFRQLVLAKPGSSVFASPYSLWSVLTLAYFGAEGRTRLQLEQALNVKSKAVTFASWTALGKLLQGKTDGAKFKSSNRAYFAKHIVLKRCLSNIIFDLRKVDFTKPQSAVNIINSDVNRTTEGKIENFIDFLPPTTRFVLINAVYFKGLWALPFDPAKTRPQEFLIPPGESAGNVQMMVQTGIFRHGYAPSLEATLLELPYNNSTTSMFLALPDQWDPDSVVQRLTRQNFVAGASQMTKKLVEVGMPRFKMTTRLEQELTSALTSMGISDLFEPGVANLTAFTISESLHADSAIHEATVEISEEGTVAAAASGLVNTRFGGNTENFFCNRPFLFFIINMRTGITLFAGKIEHPSDMERL